MEFQTQEEEEREPGLGHFPIPQEADDQVLIREKAEQGPEEQGSEEERGPREQAEGIKDLKRKSSKNYRKVSPTAVASARTDTGQCPDGFKISLSLVFSDIT